MSEVCASWWQPLVTQIGLGVGAVVWAVSRWIDRKNGQPHGDE